MNVCIFQLWGLGVVIVWGLVDVRGFGLIIASWLVIMLYIYINVYVY